MGIYINVNTFYEFENTTAFREAFHALQITHIMLSGLWGSIYYENYNKSNVYTIRQCIALNVSDKKNRYPSFFNNDNEMTYRSLDEIGAWRPET